MIIKLKIRADRIKLAVCSDWEDKGKRGEAKKKKKKPLGEKQR